VDDDGASRSLMAQILAEDGDGVVVCADGAEAIERLERDGEFDAVVSDIRMVDVDGLEVLDWVRKHAPETPVLLVTAFGNVDGAVGAIRRGAYDYISKPYDVNTIKLVVDRARQLHWRDRRPARPLRRGQRRDLVPRRDRRHRRPHPGAALAGAAGRGDPPGRRERAHPRRHAGRGGHQQGPRGGSEGGKVS